MEAEPRQVVHQRVVHALEPERLVREHLRHVVARDERVLVAEHEQRARRRAVDQVHRRLEVGDARALGAGEGPGDVEAVLGQEVVEVVAGDAPRDLRIALADQVGVAVAQLEQAAVDPLVSGSALARPQTSAVVEQHLQLVDVVGRARPGAVELRHDRADAAGVARDHPAERAVLVRRGVRPEGELVLVLGLRAQVVEDQPRLDAREAALGVDLQQAVEVLGEVDHYSDVGRLAREAGAAAPCEKRRAVLAAEPHRLDDVRDRAGNDDADRQLAVVRACRGVERAVARGEPHLAFDGRPQVVLELAHIGSANYLGERNSKPSTSGRW